MRDTGESTAIFAKGMQGDHMSNVKPWVVVAVGAMSAAATAQPAPSTADFTRALEQSLLKLRPAGMSEREVLFSNVRLDRAGREPRARPHPSASPTG